MASLCSKKVLGGRLRNLEEICQKKKKRLRTSCAQIRFLIDFG